MTSWRETGISTSPPSVEVADTDVDVLRFPIPDDETVTAARAELIVQGTLTDVSEDTLGAVTIEGDSVLVPYHGLTRGLTYELSIIPTDAAGLDWTNTLVIDCVA